MGASVSVHTTSITDDAPMPQADVPINPEDVGKKEDQIHQQNIHQVQSHLKVHTVISLELDCDHDSAMKLPLGEVSDEQLLAEVARRKLDIHEKITDSMVNETYEFGKVIGHGASAKVYIVSHRASKEQFAMKVVRKDSNMNDAQSMSTEIEIMKRIRHRHVVSMYELYETPTCLWMVLELVSGGDLYHYMATVDFLTEALVARHFKQIFQGVHYLHSLGVVHRDLKLDNILLTGSGPNCDVKIADFGLSALVRLGDGGYDPEESSKRKKFVGLKEVWGTKEYFAPEVLDAASGPQADVWSMGCMLYEMLDGHQAFGVRDGDTEETFYGRIKNADYDTSRPIWSKISPEARNCLGGLLQVNPELRLSATEALADPWISARCHTPFHHQHLTEAHDIIKAKVEEKRKKAVEKAAKKQKDRENRTEK